MSRVSTRALSRRHLALLLALGVLLGVVAASPAEAVPAKPRGLKVANAHTGPVLSWKPVRKAEEYEVEVSTTSSFNAVLWDSETVNVRSTPTGMLPLGKIYWRVRAITPAGASGWATHQFTRQNRPGPELVGPPGGVSLQQPEEPPVLRWEPVPGAREYVVEIDGEEKDWVDVETYETETTSTVVNEPQPNGTYWWRVRAVLASGANTRYSDARSYTLLPLRSVEPGETAAEMEDVVLSWAPVPGAVAYEIRVSTDDDFNKITEQRVVSGTRYSPPITYDNATYWWQVRAKDALGHAEEWPSEAESFRRSWRVAPTSQHPAPGEDVGQDDLYFEWSPVHLASRYVLDIGTDEGFSDDAFFDSCVTTQTTYAPRWDQSRGRDTCMPATAGTYYWRVRALDDPAPNSLNPDRTGVNSLFSEVRSFTYTPATVADQVLRPVSGQRVLLSGSGPTGCRIPLASGVCRSVTATPVLDWDPVPGAASYRLYLAHDENFTNMVDGYGSAANPSTLPLTRNSRWVAKTALPDTQAGEAYYWFVRPCDTAGRCGLTPTQATHAFEKKSPAVALSSPADRSAVPDQVTFVWEDYFRTNKDEPADATGERPEQAARQYRIQVSDTSTFAKLVDDRVVDQTTYTAFDRHYPEGVLYWRVQAIDGSRNGVTWSEVRSFTHASPAPTPVAPVDGERLGLLQPFRWRPLDYAKYYDVEVYQDADTTASEENLVAWARNVRQTAFTWNEPLQSRGSDFVWRVRRSDYSGNKSEWSKWHRFRVTGGSPALVSPKPGGKVTYKRAFFSWRPVPQAYTYDLQLRHGSEAYGAETVSTSYAAVSELPRGAWKWRVVALDTQDQVVGQSSWRKFRMR